MGHTHYAQIAISKCKLCLIEMDPVHLQIRVEVINSNCTFAGLQEIGNQNKLQYQIKKKKNYKNAKPQIWSNVKNILEAKISKFFNCS